MNNTFLCCAILFSHSESEIVCMYVHIYVCLSVCMDVCVYVCMYVCMNGVYLFCCISLRHSESEILIQGLGGEGGYFGINVFCKQQQRQFTVPIPENTHTIEYHKY